MTASGQDGAVVMPIREESDLVMARQQVRALGQRQRLAEPAIAALATAVTEVARNMLAHAGGGELVLSMAREQGRDGVVVVARDRGPGIADLERAMEDGYSTGGGLGLGLPSARRLVDEFAIASTAEAGTTVVMKKWRAADGDVR